jgi:hypothetical protein
MSDEDKTVREHWPRVARSTSWSDGIEQFVTSGGALLPRNPEVVR